jgi:hypothetical protein
LNHTTCDGCGRSIPGRDEPRYEVRIEVKAAADPLQVTTEDLERDFRAEITELLGRMEGLSAAEAQDQVYRVFHFDLCPACQHRYIEDPLPFS